MALLYQGQKFQTFQDFKKNMELYENDHKMKFVTQTSVTISKENIRLMATGGQPFNESLKYKNIKYTCKWGGPQRIGKGSGVRPCQSTFKIGCPVLIHLIACKDTAGNGFLEVKQFINQHQNHNCTADELFIIPECRGIDEEDTDTVSKLLKAKVPPSRIRMLLRNTKSGRVTPRDIANYRAKIQRLEQNGRSDEEVLTDLLCELVEEDPGIGIFVEKDEDGSLEVLFIQTSRMRLNVQKYGLVILFDHTYKINRNRLPVSIFKVMDGNGVGRCAGIAYVVNEEKVTLVKVVEALTQSSGEEATERWRTAVIDKDMSEAGSIKTVVPHVAIQLCDYHVGKTFNARTVKEDSKVKPILHQMRYSETDETFQRLSSQLQQLASATFWKYFEENWIKCPLAWSYRQKKKSPHLGNTTTGRVEKFNASLKLVLDSDTPLPESVRALLQMVRNKEDDVMYTEMTSTLKHCYLTTSSDPVVTKLLNEVTLYAAKRILTAKEEASGIQRRTDTTVTTCGCAHYIHTFLPCPHILQLRMQEGLNWYDPESILPMYKKAHLTTLDDRLNQAPTLHVNTAPAKVIPKSSADKYNKAMVHSKKLAMLLSECGQQQYAQRLQVLIDLWNIWAGGKEASVHTNLAGASAPLGVLPYAVLEVIEESASAETATQAVGSVVRDTLDPPAAAVASAVRATQDPPTAAVAFVERNAQDPPTAGATNEAQVRPPESRIQSESGEGGNSSAVNMELVETPPLCLCKPRKPAIRLIASATSKIPGRSFWKCGQKKPCKMFRLAKGQKRLARETVTTISAHQPQANDRHSEPSSSHCDLLEDENDVMLDLLVTAMEEDEDINQISPDVAPDEQSHQDVSDEHQNQISPNVASDHISHQGASTAKDATVTNVLKQKLSGLKIPRKVVHKGRPRGLAQTVHNHFKTGSKKVKRRPLVSTEDMNIAGQKRRERDGIGIDSTHVTVIRPGKWTVASQSSEDLYDVNKVSTPCCDTPACTKCLTCSCKDFMYRKLPCKHIYKIVSMYATVGGNTGSMNSSGINDLTLETNHVSTTDSCNGVTNRSVDIPITASSDNFNVDDDSDLPIFQDPCDILKCGVCGLPAEDNTPQCVECGTLVHTEDCSIAKGTGRLCSGCYCLLCKGVFTEGHVCSCPICVFPVVQESDVICYRCERMVHPQENCSWHIRAPEKDHVLRYICKDCFYAKTVNLSISARAQLLSNDMLTDEHIVRASLILSAQFSNKVNGLCAPMGVTRGKVIENTKYYPPHQNGTPGVQILNTGSLHWVTAIFLKDTDVKIMDSLRSQKITGHTKLQIAMICQMKGNIILARPPCKQQTNGVDCALFAIANAVEFCFTSQISYVDFDQAALRKHLLQCIENAHLTPFPRLAKRSKKVKMAEDTEVLTTYCKCCMPDNFGDMIACDACQDWFHRQCVGAFQSEEEDWFCEKCAS